MECKFCGAIRNKLSFGYCNKCYDYFIIKGYDTWYPSQYGEIAKVNKEDSPQYGMLICHICGKAFSKLQSHIYYGHNLSKEEYCKINGLDKSIRLTTDVYNKKMHDYAKQYNMDDQLRKAGENTRFKKDHNYTYKRSPQTKERLSKQIKEVGDKYKEYLRNIKQDGINYINQLEEPIKCQTINILNGPVENLNIDQLKLKCQLLGYDLERKIKL